MFQLSGFPQLKPISITHTCSFPRTWDYRWCLCLWRLEAGTFISCVGGRNGRAMPHHYLLDFFSPLNVRAAYIATSFYYMRVICWLGHVDSHALDVWFDGFFFRTDRGNGVMLPPVGILPAFCLTVGTTYQLFVEFFLLQASIFGSATFQLLN